MPADTSVYCKAAISGCIWASAAIESAVGEEDVVFSHVDLVTWTIGLSGSFHRFQFAAGFNHQSGHANDVTLRNLLDGQVVRTTIDVGMTGFIYSLAYQF